MSLLSLLEQERLIYLNYGSQDMVCQYDEAITELKYILKQVEPKTCDGCEYKSFGTKDSNMCFRCCRFFDDKFTKEDNQ